MNKNVGTLLEAYHKLRTHRRIQHALILVGAYYRTQAEVRSRFPSIINDVVLLKDVSRESLLSLYRDASLFVFPSVYEGFGLPVLEAMANKVPVITSNRSSLPEVVGDAAVLVDPLDIDGLASAILTLLTDNDLREQFRMRGLQRAREFSWEKTAKATLQVYQAVAKQGV
jgi:glycosyltransferase involved in cell wall biosynthesis